MQPLLADPERPVWSSAPDQARAPAPGEIHVWRAWLPLSPGPALQAAVSDAELRYAERMSSETARRQFTGAQAALRLTLARYLGAEPATIQFRRGGHGKPFLEPRAANDLQFNLTHSHDLALAAVTSRSEIGVDLEKVRERRAAARLAARFFAERERAALTATGEADMERVFFRLWTRKEAHIKATGTGLSVNLGAIDTLAPDAEWWYHEFTPDAQYVASLAGTGPQPRISYFELNLPQ